MLKTTIQRLVAIAMDGLIATAFVAGVSLFFYFGLIWKASYIPIVCLFLFFLLQMLLNGSSIGKSIFHLNVVSPYRRFFVILFIREIILKFGLFLALPAVLLNSVFHIYIVYALLISLTFTLVINIVCFLFSGKFIWDLILKTSVTKMDRKVIKKPHKYRLCATTIDLAIIFTLTLCFWFLLQNWWVVATHWLVAVVCISYYCVSYIFCNSTIGKILFNNKIEFPAKRFKVISVLLREVVFKWGMALLLFALLTSLHYENILYNLTAIAFLYLFVCTGFQIVYKTSAWNYYTHTTVVHSHTINYRKKYLYLGTVVVFTVLSFFGLQHFQNCYSTESSLLGFHYYVYNVHHPVNNDIKEKVAFIKQQPTAKEYIFNLFEQYDIVIICERWHHEMTQWDFIYEIVSDPRFTANVGHVFTEVGAPVGYQYLADEYFTTKYANDTLLNKATTNLLRHDGHYTFWECWNIFNFFKRLNQLNTTLPDSLKIREYFTDEIDYFASNITSPEKYHDYDLKQPHRDSCMAQVVIDKFKEIQQQENRKKILLITNYRHAFNDTRHTKQKRSYIYFSNEASYIFHTFPNQTANVLLNVTAVGETGLPGTPPIHKSSWDKAFELCDNPYIGFNFASSPFGEDKFDLKVNWGRRDTLHYQDIFTGFVFYQPLSKMWFQTGGFPYKMNDFEQEYQRRLYLSGQDTTNMKAKIEIANNCHVTTSYFGHSKLYLFYNNMEVSLYLFFTLVSSVILLIIFISTIVKQLTAYKR